MIIVPPKPSSPDHGKQQVMLLADIISQLPDHVLVRILSLLTIKEAGRTSILSNRWRNLWTSYPNLTFDVSKTLSSLMYEERSEKEQKTALAAAKHAYLNWVNQVVKSHRGPTIDRFVVQFGLNRAYSNQINEWVQFAFQKNVRRLTLDLFDSRRAYPMMDGYCFPDIVGNMLGISNSLTSLRLVDVNVTGEILQWFLSTCLLLESLVVHRSMTLLNLEAHTTSLKSLQIELCSKLTSAVVNEPNLASFSYFGDRIGLQLCNSHKLTHIAFGGDIGDYVIQNNPLEFYSHLAQLEALKLEVTAFEELVLVPEFPLLARLKRLEVIVVPTSLLGFASMIKACLLLSEVTFKLMEIRSQDYVDPVVGQSDVICLHHSIKVVNLVGFVGSAIDVELALYLIKNAVVLEKRSLDTRDPYLIGTVLEFEETEWREAATERARRFATKLPPGVTSVII